METAKRTSSTSPPHQRPAKIRESCDNCGISKVKCGRQQPRCLPCLERGLACSYSPSRRSATHSTTNDSGREDPRSTTIVDTSSNPFLPHLPSRVDDSSRHPVNRNRSGSHATASPRLTDGVGKTKRSPPPLQDSAQYINGAMSSNSSGETPSDPRVREKDRPLFDTMADEKVYPGSAMDVDVQGYGAAGFRDHLNSDFDFDALCRSLTPSAFLACVPKEIFDTAPEQDPTVFGHTFEFSAGTGRNTPDTFSPVPKYGSSTKKPQDMWKSVESCSNSGTTCMVSALKILQALHIPPPACLWACDETSMPSPREPRMIDSVLSTNRDVVLSVSEILECSCSSSFQVQLILTIICGKLMAWYRAMIRNDNNGYNNSPTMEWSIANISINNEEQTERVLHQPITVGDYSFDVGLESKIRAQVVFSELQHLEALVNTLSIRTQEVNVGNLCTAAAARSGSASVTGSGSMTPDEMGLAEGIHRSLSAFLHEQMEAAKAETLLC